MTAHLPPCERRTAPLFPVPPCLLVGLFLSAGDVSFSHSFVICHTSASLFTGRRAETCVHHLRLLLDRRDRRLYVDYYYFFICCLLFPVLHFAQIISRKNPEDVQEVSQNEYNKSCLLYFFCVVTFSRGKKKSYYGKSNMRSPSVGHSHSPGVIHQCNFDVSRTEYYTIPPALFIVETLLFQSRK